MSNINLRGGHRRWRPVGTSWKSPIRDLGNSATSSPQSGPPVLMTPMLFALDWSASRNCHRSRAKIPCVFFCAVRDVTAFRRGIPCREAAGKQSAADANKNFTPQKTCRPQKRPSVSRKSRSYLFYKNTNFVVLKIIPKSNLLYRSIEYENNLY